MSLRLRLTLVILAVVAPMALAGLISLGIHRGIQRQVTQLGRTSSVALGPAAVVGQALELEGTWDDAGFFLAIEIERLPWSRRPKLRGPVQAVDRTARTLRVYGRTIGVISETEFPHAAPDDDPLAGLAPGVRVEVSCRMEQDGGWIARKVETRGIKLSDKVKGVITRAEGRPDGRCALEIDGLAIQVEPDRPILYSRGPLYRMENATQMTVAVQECLAAAQELLSERYRLRDLLAASGTDPAARRARARIEDVEERVEDGYESFARYLAESTSPASAEGDVQLAAWLEPLEQAREVFQARSEEFLRRVALDPDAGQRALQDELEPALRSQVLPVVHAFGLELEEQLAERLETITTRSVAASHLTLTANVVGLLLALAAGLLVARSISRPVRALAAAAHEVGHGNLQARVEVRTRDEIGGLAAAFNRMAGDLAERERREQGLRRSLSDKDLLLREVHHRVKNNLQVISSLLDLQSRSVRDPQAVERFQESQDRIRSMVFIHDQLFRGGDLEAIDLQAYLELLVTNLVQSHADRPDRIVVRVEVDPIRLDLDRALACGLIVNELVTNAFKHAFPDGARGEIVVSCRERAGGVLRLEVADDGLGFEGELARAEAGSLGLSLVTTLAEQLRGRLLRVGRAGSVLRVEFPQHALEEVA